MFENWESPGVYIMNLEKGDVSLHAVCIDARLALTLVYDCYESHALRFSRVALGCCCGDDSTFKRLVEVRRVVVNRPNGKRKHTRSERSEAKKRYRGEGSSK